jgi:hypothetical protein
MQRVFFSRTGVFGWFAGTEKVFSLWMGLGEAKESKDSLAPKGNSFLMPMMRTINRANLLHYVTCYV